MSSPLTHVEQGHLTLVLQTKSPADGQALRDKIPAVMPAFATAADALGTLHYFRVIAIDPMQFLLIAEYDGELEAILRAMATGLGPVMDGIFSHLEAPPPMPVARNPDAFIDWAAEHQISPFTVYENYPGVSVNRRPQAKSAGSRRGRTRIAVSCPSSERRSIAGALGEAHAKEWPGAMMPALAALASRPTPSCSSTSVTSCPSVAR